MLNYCTTALISHASKVMLKILQARLQEYMNRELPDVQAGFRKGRGTRDQIASICWIMEKAKEFQKNIYFCFIDYTKAFDCVWESHFLGRLIRSLGVPKERRVWNSQGGKKDTFFSPLHSLGFCILPEDSLWIKPSG